MEDYSRFQNSIAELREQIKQDRESSKLYSIMAPIALTISPIVGAVAGYLLLPDFSPAEVSGAGTLLGGLAGFIVGLLTWGISCERSQECDKRASEHIGKISELEEKAQNSPQ